MKVINALILPSPKLPGAVMDGSLDQAAVYDGKRSTGTKEESCDIMQINTFFLTDGGFVSRRLYNEQHYTSNIQKNQLVQKDIQIAKKLQGMEDEERKLHSSEEQKQIEESDSEIARAIQEDIQRKAEESRQREEKDQELAKQLQDLEEEAIRQKKKQMFENSNGERGDDTEPLHWVIANLELQTLEQLRQDEELAQRLQEEEHTSIRARKNRERNDDYRAAQVAQDEGVEMRRACWGRGWHQNRGFPVQWERYYPSVKAPISSWNRTEEPAKPGSVWLTS
uniref:Uncharacterized protein n=1 Tax=Sphaerodactylus townsendi TaxID=933632 RepID=A0ACB8ED82_9SAUR